MELKKRMRTNVVAVLDHKVGACLSSNPHCPTRSVSLDHSSDHLASILTGGPSPTRAYPRLVALRPAPDRRLWSPACSQVTLCLVCIMTFWALFADDIMYGTPLEKSVDVPFAYVSLVFMIVFMIELVARTIAQWDEYAFTFFWLMELVAKYAHTSCRHLMS